MRGIVSPQEHLDSSAKRAIKSTLGEKKQTGKEPSPRGRVHSILDDISSGELTPSRKYHGNSKVAKERERAAKYGISLPSESDDDMEAHISLSSDDSYADFESPAPSR